VNRGSRVSRISFRTYVPKQSIRYIELITWSVRSIGHCLARVRSQEVHTLPECDKLFCGRRVYSAILLVRFSGREHNTYATVVSKSFLVAPILTATPKPCIISSQPSPIRCRPTIFSSGPWHIILNCVGIFAFSSFGKTS